MKRREQVVVAGAGHAGVQLAASLRGFGFDGQITLIGEEPCLPYERPPLSKELLGTENACFQTLHPLDHYSRHQVDLLNGVRVVGIDRGDQTVSTSSHEDVAYDHLVVATGATPRRLPVDGCDLDGVHVLRTSDDARALRAGLVPGAKLAVVGAGFIGLEVAAAAAAHGLDVTVVEAFGRVMERSVSPEISAYFERYHREAGVHLILGKLLHALIGADGRVQGLLTSDGTYVCADLVLIGAGVVPACDLAVQAGLEVANGIVVDGQLLTADPRISAIGDCAAFPHPDGRLVRLESIQNAADQARLVAARLTGTAAAYRAVPWFWSIQGSRKLQIVGLDAGVTSRRSYGDPTGRYSVFGFRQGRLAVVESVNDPGNHIWARKLFEAGSGSANPDETVLHENQFVNGEVDFKALARRAIKREVDAP